MTARGDNKPMMDTIKTLVPAIVPLFASMWESKSPKAQADLVATMAENQLTSISMMAELINAFGQGQSEPPFWLPMAQETLKGVVQAAEAMANKNKGAVGQPLHSHGPSVEGAVQAQADQFTPEQITNFIFNDPRYPAWGRSEEWRQALILLHSKSEEAAPYIANLLRTLDDENRTPPEIEPVWENATEVLQQIISPMPIWQMDNAYAVRTINGIIDILTEEGDDTQPHVAEAPPEGAAVVEAPPTQAVETTGNAQTYPVAGHVG